MKKLALLLVLVLLLGLTACQAPPKEIEDPVPTPTPTPVVEYDPIKKTEYDITKNEYYEQVLSVLGQSNPGDLEGRLVKADNTAYAYDEGYAHRSGKARVYTDQSIGYPFAYVSAQLNANPIAGFHALCRKGYFEKEKSKPNLEFQFDMNEDYSNYMLYSKSIPVAKASYAYSEVGCLQFLRAADALMRSNENLTLIFSAEINFYPELIPVAYSQKDDCYYGFLHSYDTTDTTTVAVYFHSSDGKTITDVEVQILNIFYPTGDYAAGISMSNGLYRESKDFGIICMMTAIEQLMTGESYFHKMNLPENHSGESYLVPGSYRVGDCKVTVGLETFYNNSHKTEVVSEEYASLYTYQIHRQ
ncbi:MAG: hypothetical protein J6K51_06940 [Clostridia bacterium]|nr:hypothetical protein [Clostridia bacterium]